MVARLIFLAFLILSGCQVHSMIILENPEFPESLLPTEISLELQKKYAIGDVFVQPRIVYADSAQTTFKAFTVFFSKTNFPTVSIEDFELSVSGKKFEYGQDELSDSCSDWELYPARKPFYVCSVSGEPIKLSKVEIVKGRVNISLTVSIEENSGKIIEKKIESYFLPKKRSYIE